MRPSAQCLESRSIRELRTRGLQEAPFSAALRGKDRLIGRIPTEPQCIPPSKLRARRPTDPDPEGVSPAILKSDRPYIQSVLLNPEYKEGVSNVKDNWLLRFQSLAAGKERLDTVLHVLGASSKLSIADFKRILPQGQHIPEWRSEGGLTKIIPVRDPKTLNRSDQWLLTFSTPYHAALYHSRLLWYHQNAKVNTTLPVRELVARRSLLKDPQHPDLLKEWSPTIAPMPSVIDPRSGEDLWQRNREYTIYPPSQRAVLKLHIPPFPPPILNNLWWHHQWTKADSKGRVAYPVMISLFPDQEWFTGPVIWEFIRKDGAQRGLAWDVYDGQSGVEKMFHATFKVADGNVADFAIDMDVGVGPVSTERFEEEPMDRNKWMIRFRDEDEAKRFIRRWNHREWDEDLGAAGENVYTSPRLRLDRLW